MRVALAPYDYLYTTLSSQVLQWIVDFPIWYPWERKTLAQFIWPSSWLICHQLAVG